MPAENLLTPGNRACRPRLMFFEQARKQAEEDFEANSRDAQVCAPLAHPTQRYARLKEGACYADRLMRRWAGTHPLGRSFAGAGSLSAGRGRLQDDRAGAAPSCSNCGLPFSVSSACKLLRHAGISHAMQPISRLSAVVEYPAGPVDGG